MEVSEASCDEVMMSPEAFRAFYRTHLPSVYVYLLRLCAGDTAQAEDLTQDVWLARFIDHVRRQRLGLARLSLMPRLHQRDDQPTDSEVLARHAALPPLYRFVLLLRYVDGLTVPEVADAIGRGVEPTNSLLARARSRLRQLERRDSDDSR